MSVIKTIGFDADALMLMIPFGIMKDFLVRPKIN